MVRPLIKHGQSTLMVSLPKRWLDKQGLKKGDCVNISELPGKIILSKGEKNIKTKETSLHLPKADYSDIRIALGRVYRDGYEKITITYDDPTCTYLLQSIVRTLKGCEIFNKREKSCVIKNIIKEMSINVTDVLNKIINTIKTEFFMVKDFLIRGVKNKEEDIRLMRDDCWKYRNFT